MDKARKKTDKMLSDLERRIQAVYVSDPALLRIQKRYEKYMEQVEKACKDEYTAFIRETDKEHKEALKKAYIAKVKSLTTNNKLYKSLVNEVTKVMASVNQKALDLANAEMTDIYTLNYNQIEEDCRKVGIEVDG